MDTLICYLSALRHRPLVLAVAHGTVENSVHIPTVTAIKGTDCVQAFRLEIPQRRTD